MPCRRHVRVCNGPGRAGTGRTIEPVDWSIGRALIYLKPVAQPVGPQAGLAGRAWVKIKIVFSFEGKGIRTPSLIGASHQLS